MSAGTDIPTRSRELVRAREGGQCRRCGGHGNQWHHRRTRKVRGEHRHCPCNGVLLCPTCHRWVHRYPVQAKAVGLVVSTAVLDPGTVPIRGLWGWAQFSCGGAAAGLSGENIVMTHGAPSLVS